MPSGPLLFLPMWKERGVKQKIIPENEKRVVEWKSMPPRFILMKEQVSHSPDIIFISIFSLFNNELSIKKDKATHDHQSHIQVCLTKEE